MTTSLVHSCFHRGHEQVVFFNYPDFGLRVIIAIHDTTLGPSLGGCRMREYASEDQALEDVLRLSEGMTYKSALAGLPLGGGKAVILCNPALQEGRQALFHKFGECLNAVAGRYISAEDMGTSVRDVMWMREASKFVVGTDPKQGGAGDPSPWTALGVLEAMRAAVAYRSGRDPSLKGTRVSVQGIGHVGMHLVKLLSEQGAKVSVSDSHEDALVRASQEFGATAVPVEAIYDVPCDIFSPCAVGQTVNEATLKRLSCSIIAGAANNQLPDRSVYEILSAKKVVYCPDFAVNSGGVICVSAEMRQGAPDMNWVEKKVRGIFDTTMQVLVEAERRGRFPEEVAVELAKERIAAAKSRRQP